MKSSTAVGMTMLFLIAFKASAAPSPDSASAAPPASDSGQSGVSTAPAAGDSTGTTAFARCSVLTVPAEALVYFDDSLRGKSPLVIDSLKPGKHEIQLKKKGFFVKKAVVNLEPGKTATVSFELLKPSRLLVVSDPAGATVRFGPNDSCIAPCSNEKLKAGVHLIEVSRAGYVTQKDTVTLSAGAGDSLRVKLRQAGAPAAAQSGSTPKGVVRALISLGVFVVFAVVVLIVETNH